MDNKKKARERTKKWYKENRQKAIEYARRYRIDNKEMLKAKYSVYNKENREKINTKQRVYNKTAEGKIVARKHRENKKQYYKEHNQVWYKENKDKSRAMTRKRRDLKLKYDCRFTSDDEEFIRLIFRGRCFGCGSTDRLQIDHHRPLSSGNGLRLSNAVLLCISCNSAKGNKPPEEFYTKDKLEQLREMGIK